MTGVLLIHGFAGTREEVRPLYDYLTEKGMRVELPCLAGHEATAAALARSGRRKWEESVRGAYRALAGECERVVVVGFSMGGLLAMGLCQGHAPHRLVLVNTPVYYWDFKQMASNLRCDFQRYGRRYWERCADKPLRALWEFQRLLSESKRRLGGVPCEVLIVQAQNDDIVNAKSGAYLFNALPGAKKLLTPAFGEHYFFLNPESRGIMEEIARFIAAP